MFGFGRKTTMVTADEAMTGRAERPYQVSETNRVLGTPQTGPVPDGHEEIFFGMGCFWGSERIFWRIPGVYTTAAGYLGGFTTHPTYEETCTARTGHTEAVRVVYDPTKVDLEALLKGFWENHDPTQVNGQGNDIGTQYRSAIYTTTDAQLMQAEESRNRYQKALDEAGYGQIATDIVPADSLATPFYFAEDYHQQYLDKNPGGYCNHGYCQAPYNTGGDRQQVTKVELPEA